MHAVWIAAWKDLRRMLRDPTAFAVWIGIPFVIGGLIALAAGGGDGGRPRPHLLVVDSDQTFLSRFLLAAVGQEASGSFVRAERVEPEDGRRRIEAGEASALLTIPEGFASSVLLEEPLTLELVTNPSQSILPLMIEEAASMLVDAVFYLQRLIGEDLRELAQGPSSGAATFDDQRIAELSVEINQLIERAGVWLFPPVIELETVDPEARDEPEPAGGIAALFLPGILFLSLLFMAQGISGDLWQELEQATLLRSLVAPAGMGPFLGGKLLAGSVLMLGVAMPALAAGIAYLELSWAALAPAALWAAASGALLLLMMMLLQTLASSQRAGSLLTMSVMFPLMMIGGSFFPFEAMPEWMVAIGQRTPNGWALMQLRDLLALRVDPTGFAASAAGLLGVGAALFWVTARRLRTRFAAG